MGREVRTPLQPCPPCWAPCAKDEVDRYWWYWGAVERTIGGGTNDGSGSSRCVWYGALAEGTAPGPMDVGGTYTLGAQSKVSMSLTHLIKYAGSEA